MGGPALIIARDFRTSWNKPRRSPVANRRGGAGRIRSFAAGTPISKKNGAKADVRARCWLSLRSCARVFEPRAQLARRQGMNSPPQMQITLSILLSSGIEPFWSLCGLPVPSRPPFIRRGASQFSTPRSFDSVNNIVGRFTPYLVCLPDVSPQTSQVAATDQAAHDVLLALYPTFQTSLDGELQQDLAQIPDGKPKSDGIAVGQTVLRFWHFVRTMAQAPRFRRSNPRMVQDFIEQRHRTLRRPTSPSEAI